MNSEYVSVKNELDSIMADFDEFINMFDSAVNLITDNLLVDKEKYGNKEIGNIYSEVREIRNLKRDIERKVRVKQA